MPCKERLETPRYRRWLYRPCTASFGVGSLNNWRSDDFENEAQGLFRAILQDEKDWLCTIEFLSTDDPEARLYGADIIGYLVGYANLTNTRSLAFLGDPDAGAYELNFLFRLLRRKTSS
jgi:hypothetical protein